MKIENIKFKAKRLDNGEWVEGDVMHTIEDTIIIEIDGVGVHVIEPSTVCQFTGLKDCRGEELFEHDLIHFIGFRHTAELIWSEDNYAFMIVCENKHLYWLHDVIEVSKIERIGNKFDKESSV